VAAVGTMALRTASNGAGFVAEVERQTQLRIEVLSGEEESRLACLAVASGLGLAPGTTVIFDTGGGSTQFTFARGAAVLNRLSVSVGAVRVMEAHRLEGAVTRANLQQALDAVAAELACLDGLDRPEVLVGMGGGVVTLAAVMFELTHYDPDRIQGAVLPRAEVWRQIELYRSRPTELRRQIPGLQPQRAEVILAGACIIWTILKKLRKTSLTVSDRGLRHGVLVDRFGTYTGRQK
jgi:exopolyphosphatase/guanosine-5'-triphosphate,3'-diphosphate pyrophosphatase